MQENRTMEFCSSKVPDVLPQWSCIISMVDRLYVIEVDIDSLDFIAAAEEVVPDEGITSEALFAHFGFEMVETNEESKDAIAG